MTTEIAWKTLPILNISHLYIDICSFSIKIGFKIGSTSLASGAFSNDFPWSTTENLRPEKLVQLKEINEGIETTDISITSLNQRQVFKIVQNLNSGFAVV